MLKHYWVVLNNICEDIGVSKKHKRTLHEEFKKSWGIVSVKDLTDDEFLEFIWEIQVFEATHFFSTNKDMYEYLRENSL